MSTGHVLPSVKEVEASAQLGATTCSMRVAWQIAADLSLLDRKELERLIDLQLNLIDQELAVGRCSQDARETLTDMRADYRRHLNGGHAVGVNG